jgi:cellulose synthase/poly-beta-1,6-N-acetylglucosamine synthase-like glycosyltransferase
VLLWLAAGSIMAPELRLSKNPSLTSISILICARNEAEHIVSCLKSIIAQDYDKSLLEIIVIDDQSVDATKQLALSCLEESGINFRIISNASHLGKKKSLQHTIPLAQHQLIVTRDADTYTLSDQWLKSLAAAREQGADVMIAPISMADNGGLLKGLQSSENQVLRIISAGSAFFGWPFLNSGANFAFTKSVFEKTNGYTSHLELASGEDVFFLNEAQKLGDTTIVFVKSEQAMVYTYPASSWSALFKQRARWASKVLKRPTPLALGLGLLNLITNLVFIYAVIVFILSPQRDLLLFLIFKAGIDFLLLFLGPGCYEKRSKAWRLLPFTLVYPVYALVVGVASIFLKPKWKA